MYYAGSMKVWADDLASGKPAPGGGSAAALVGAAGCACLSMAANFTVGKPDFKQAEAEVRDALDRIEKDRAELGRLVDEDVEQYSRITSAYGMPKGTDAEKAARKAAIQEALKAAVDVPRRACRVVHRALAHAPLLLAEGNPNLVSDVGVGAQCLASAFRCAWLNVEINLASLKDAAFVSAVRAELEPLAAEVERTAAEVWAGAVRKVKKG